jgi:hypothetical protein
MTQADYLQRFEALCQEELALTGRKNADYADAANALLNFRLIEHVTNGRLTMYDGLLVRMTDKFQRFANLLTRDAQVSDEAIEDTLRDLSVYSKIALLALQWEKEQTCAPAMIEDGLSGMPAAPEPVIAEDYYEPDQNPEILLTDDEFTNPIPTLPPDAQNTNTNLFLDLIQRIRNYAA